MNIRAFDNIKKFELNVERVCLLSEEILEEGEGLKEGPSLSFPQVKY